MKRIILLLVIGSLIYSCNTEEPLPPNTYEITGNAKGIVNGLRAYIKVSEGNKEIAIDTAIVMNETFTFRGNAAVPIIAKIEINSVPGNLPFVFEPSRMHIEINKDSLYFSSIEGSKNNDDYNRYKDAAKGLLQEIRALKDQAAAATETEERRAFLGQTQEKTEYLQDYAYEFINNNVNSEFSLLLLESKVGDPNAKFDKIKENFANLQGVIKRNPYFDSLGKKINGYMAILEANARLDYGKIAPDFTSPTPEGKMLALNDVKGKATIIDFWASWCGPCRRENPNIVKVYEKYHEKGLEIISVSLDRPGQKDRWLKAIEDDKLTWNHVGSLQYFNDPVARMYNVSAIPSMFVLDEQGRIVGKKLRGQALHDKISQLLD